MFHQLHQVEKAIGRIEMVLSVLMMAVMVIILGLAVVFRYAVNQPLVWSSDLSTLMLVWLSFIGASVALKGGAHVGVDVLIKKFSPLGRNVIGAISGVVVLVAVLMTGWVAVDAVKLQSTQFITTLGLPRSFYSLPIIWAAVSMSITIFLQIVDNGSDLRQRYRNRREGRNGDGSDITSR